MHINTHSHVCDRHKTNVSVSFGFNPIGVDWAANEKRVADTKRKFARRRGVKAMDGGAGGSEVGWWLRSE